MINSALYRQPVLLDPALHRGKRITPLADFSITRHMHAVFVTVAEVPQAVLEFPVVFIHTGDRGADGKPIISPIVLLGLTQNENLYVEGTKWAGRYIPAFIRRYPFLTANLKGAPAPGVLIDTAWSGWSETEGEPLFLEGDKRAPALDRAVEFLEKFEVEAQRTRAFCQRLGELDLLKEMKADATLPDGTTMSIDGFHIVDEQKLAKMSDAAVLEMHRNGMLAILHLHLASTGNLRHLVERKARLQLSSASASAGAGSPAPAVPAAPAAG